MNKMKFSKAALTVLFSLTIAVHAQQQENKISRIDSSTKSFKIKREFSLKAKPGAKSRTAKEICSPPKQKRTLLLPQIFPIVRQLTFDRQKKKD